MCSWLSLQERWVCTYIYTLRWSYTSLPQLPTYMYGLLPSPCSMHTCMYTHVMYPENVSQHFLYVSCSCYIHVYIQHWTIVLCYVHWPYFLYNFIEPTSSVCAGMWGPVAQYENNMVQWCITRCEMATTQHHRYAAISWWRTAKRTVCVCVYLVAFCNAHWIHAVTPVPHACMGCT